MWSWFRWFGILLGAISLFSLVQKLSDFGLAPIFKDMLAFYRAFFHPLADIITTGLRWVLALVSIKLPQIPADAVVIYLLIGAACFRSYLETALDEYSEDPVTSTVVLLSPITWPIVFVLLLFVIIFDFNNNRHTFIDTSSFWAIEITKVVAAFFILFAWNYHQT
jgi:hypothetical protein